MELNAINENINVHLRDYLNILRRRKWIFISFFLITITAITLATFIQNPVYRAAATIIVDMESPDILPETDVITLGEREYYLYRDYIETQLEIIKSRRIAHQVMKNLQLSKLAEFKKKKDTVQYLLKKLHVKLIRDTRIIQISFDHKDPKLASRIVNEFANIYVNSNVGLKINTSKQAQEWFKKEVEKQKKKVNSAELELQIYKEKNNIFSIENQQAIINDALTRLSANYLDAQKKRMHSETTYKSLVDQKYNATLENLPASLVNNENLQRLKDDFLKQQVLLIEYRKIYKHKHPKMIRLLENITYLKSLIDTEIETEYNNVLRKAETEYENALEEENKSKIVLGAQRKTALEFERKIINYSALERELRTNEKILQTVLNRLKETSIATKIQANNVRIQDIAEIPRKSIKPKKIRQVHTAFEVASSLRGNPRLFNPRGSVLCIKT